MKKRGRLRKKRTWVKCLRNRSASKKRGNEEKNDMLEHRIPEESDAAGAKEAGLKGAGRKQLIEQLFRRNYSAMRHLAKVFLGDADEAEDVVQDIFLRLADCDIPPRKDSYLMTAVRNACLNRIRQKQLHEKVKGLLPVEDGTDLQPVDKEMERLDGIAVFVDEQMEEPHRSIFHLRFDEDLTIAEIARRLHLNPNTAYKYLAQCIQEIRKHVNH